MNLSNSPLLEQSVTIRSGVSFAIQGLIFLWTYYVVAPAHAGSPRIIRSAALLPLLIFLPTLYRKNEPSELVLLMYTVHNFLWLTATKVTAFCLNRGQLVKSYESRSRVAFALSLLCPITLDFKATAAENGNGKHVFKDVQFSVIKFTGREKMKVMTIMLFQLIARASLL